MKSSVASFSLFLCLGTQAFAFNLNTINSLSPQNSVAVTPVMPLEMKVTVPRPQEWPATFKESDFEAKPWVKEFAFVIVANKATKGQDKQSLRIYKNGHLVSYEEIQTLLTQYHEQQSKDLMLQYRLMEAYKSNNPEAFIPFGFSADETEKSMKQISKEIENRPSHLRDLKNRMWAPGVFKVSSGRDEFEPKGTHHSQKDSWSVTPTGYFTPQLFSKKHKSESYSAKLCDSIFGKLVGAVLQKELCTYMENAIFFNGPIAFHNAIPGTEAKLGQKASGGCIRLPPALGEYLYLSLLAEKGKALPVVNPDGTLKVDSAGRVIYSDKVNSIWGQNAAHSALIIVQNEVVN